MTVMVMVRATADSEAGVMPSTGLLTEMAAYNQQLMDAGILQSGEGLKPSAEGVRVILDGAKRDVVDGPFAEAKELIAGFWLWKVESMKQAIEWAQRCPNPTGAHGALEIRPIFEADDFGEEYTPELREREDAMRAELERGD